MSNCSEHKNPLQHNGTSQLQRLLPGLDKNKFALVDEKDFADWIVFANGFAAFINYYDSSDKIAGNWQPFFNSDISAQLGTIAIQNIERYRLEIKERFDFIKDDDNKTSITAIKIKLNELFSALLTLSKALDDYAQRLPVETTLKNTILNLIQTKLAPALKRLIAYYYAADASHHNYLNNTSLSDWNILNKSLTDAAQIIDIDGLNDIWLYDTSETNWIDYKNSIIADDSIYNDPLNGFADDYLSISHAANHNLFSGIFDTYLTAYTKIINDAEAELLRTLNSFNAHAPHYALFLCFLRLFKFAQANINTITQRHLDFYYREVLRLQPKPAEANKVHVLAELAKQVDEYLLAKGTELKAGKDSLNKDVFYTLDNDAVFTKAKVAQLKTFYKAANSDSIYTGGALTQDNTNRVFASPVTNSEDGSGAELTSANKEWHPFVHKVFEDAQLKTISMPKAQIGFALASHYLYLTEGERKVFIRFVLSNNAALDGKHIECYLTTDKGWYKVDNSLAISSASKKLSDGITDCAEISFTIPGSAPAITNYNVKVHGGTYNVAVPLLKIYLVNDDLLPYEYDALKDIIITKTEIRVEVGMDGTYSQKGLKNLLLTNDFGVLDASKPFMPFGPQPEKDAGLVIGNKEIFIKKNAAVSLNIEWADLPNDVRDINYNSTYASTQNTTTHLYSYTKDSNATPYYPNVQPFFLQSGIWDKRYGNGSSQMPSKDIFNGVNNDIVVSFAAEQIPDNAVFNYADDDYSFTTKSTNGFLKLVLNDGFGYQKYLTDLSTYLIEKNLSTYYPKEVGVLPTPPYTPKIKSLYVSYSANQNIDITSTDENIFNNREIQLFHIYPFGEGEQHKYLQPSHDVFLLPQFKHKADGLVANHIGEFYIGIENLNPGDAVNILFQVMEGTTNPTVAKPEKHVQWSWLANNEWTEFADEEISDNTLQLVQSGIISFPIHKEATATNTILPPGFIWLKASVKEAAEAVCKLISVDAQAAVATFTNNNNTDDFLNNALPASTISKLKNPDAAIKKINQPYPSFGGRAKESDEHFYIRVSERLRHKARAINVWDYEHIVLEAFPEIYKVKCLNHTQVDNGTYNEVKPGYVSIITIPSLTNRNDADPLKPYTQQSTLTNIENYLRKCTSCFVNLRACQPQFEEVRLEFSLKLYDQYKDFNFYADKLKEEITQFLSPWAFGGTNTIDFGGKVYKSVLINFIEERYYVDYITDVFMYVKVDDITPESADMDEITASTARSILVSAPASKHEIHQINETDEDAQETCMDIKVEKI